MPNSVFCQFVATGRPADITRLWNAASLPARAVPALSSLLEHASRPLPRNCTPLDVFRQVEATELLRRERRFFDFKTLAPSYRFPGGRQYRGSRVADVTSRLGSRDSLAIEFNVDWLMPPGFWGAFAEAWPDVNFAASWACEMGSFVGYALRFDGRLQERNVENARRFAAAQRERDKTFAPLLDALRGGRPLSVRRERADAHIEAIGDSRRDRHGERLPRRLTRRPRGGPAERDRRSPARAAAGARVTSPIATRRGKVRLMLSCAGAAVLGWILLWLLPR